MKEYHGYEKRGPNGEYGYLENPNAKWDWFEIGGRRVGYFKLKDGRHGLTGRSGVFEYKKKFDVDQARKGDIDFEFIRLEAADKAKKEYEEVESVFGGEIPKLQYKWKDVIDTNSPFKDFDIETKRALYHGQEILLRIRDLRNKENSIQSEVLRYLDENFDSFQCSKEEYIKNSVESSIPTFAVIKDGKWYSRGKMGWWGVVSDEKETNLWNVEFNKLIDSLSDDTLLTVVDCHI